MTKPACCKAHGNVSKLKGYGKLTVIFIFAIQIIVIIRDISRGMGGIPSKPRIKIKSIEYDRINSEQK